MHVIYIPKANISSAILSTMIKLKFSAWNPTKQSDVNNYITIVPSQGGDWRMCLTQAILKLALT